MFTNSWLRRRKPRRSKVGNSRTQSGPSQHSRWRFRPQLEPLETRVLLSDVPLGGSNEPYIAVNPTNSLNVVVSDVNTLLLSTDGGATFPTVVNSTAVASFRGGGDDSLAFDSQGHLFWCYLE